MLVFEGFSEVVSGPLMYPLGWIAVTARWLRLFNVPVLITPSTSKLEFLLSHYEARHHDANADILVSSVMLDRPCVT